MWVGTTNSGGSGDAGTGTWTYSYDGAGRMLTAAGPDQTGASKAWSYTYDGQGNRLSWAVGTTTTTWTEDLQEPKSERPGCAMSDNTNWTYTNSVL